MAKGAIASIEYHFFNLFSDMFVTWDSSGDLFTRSAGENYGGCPDPINRIAIEEIIKDALFVVALGTEFIYHRAISLRASSRNRGKID